MSSLWLSWSLLYAATFLQSGASADERVDLKCNTSVAVVAGETVTLNCSISHVDSHFIGTQFVWQDDTLKGNICDSKKYQCEWDNVTYVSLTISNVVEEKNYTITIMGPQGRNNRTIEVQVIQPEESARMNRSIKPESAFYLLCIFIPLIALDFSTSCSNRHRQNNNKNDQEGKASRRPHMNRVSLTA